LPDLPTLIAVAPFTGPAELPSFKPFEKLLEGLASSAEPVAPQTVECLVETRGLAMSLAKPGSVGRLSTDLFGKSITVSNEANTGAQFDFSRWYADHRSAILLHARVPAGQNCVSLVFRPGGDNARGFQSFRLVALDPARRPEPVSLERYFWAQGGTNLLDWLLPPLQARISQWQWPPGSRLQMRPQALQPRTAQSFDLYEALPAFAQPPPGQDMDLHLVRTNLAARLKSVEEEMAALERKLRSSLTNLAENPALAYGWPYGRLLPESAEAALHSFPAYLGARKAQPSTFTLVEYVRRVLDAGGKRFGDATEAMRLLDNPATQLQGLREAQRVVRAFAGSARRNLPVPPGDHLFALGQELQHHGRLAAELEAKVAEEERVKLGLRLTRPAATVLHYGSLFLLHPAGKVELLRFDQPRPRVAP
jgi:hypothetical protein